MDLPPLVTRQTAKLFCLIITWTRKFNSMQLLNLTTT